MLRSKIGRFVLIGMSVVALGACGEPAARSADAPTFVTPSATPTISTEGAAPSSPAPAPPSASGAPAGSATPTTSATPEAKAATHAFPVVGKASYAHVHHDYPATDIITACGNKVVAASSGTIAYVVRKDTWNAKVNAGATRGGLSVGIVGDDGVRYYGSHFSAIDPAIQVGAHVSTGQTLGRIGETGDASACHLHFGISPPCARGSDWWTQRGTIWPWPYLDSWRKGGNKSPVAEISAWKAKNGCPTKPRVDP
ncbi:M23 family metallopeptidase [Krasilnikovia sp. MM14-A1259]|uniref:M23 family metallopeptidase n=1 Tax=Krasilnikovia sp. MM14-A1259 TaxID=3373539 RepID=UPI0038058E99